MSDWLRANWHVVASAVGLMCAAFLLGWRLRDRSSVEAIASGSVSSLEDVITRLDAAAQEGKAAAEKLRVNAEVAERLADIHKLTLDQIINLLRQLQVSAAAHGATGLRIEAQAEQVASDLDESHKRAADVSHDSNHGAAADAFASKP